MRGPGGLGPFIAGVGITFILTAAGIPSFSLEWWCGLIGVSLLVTALFPPWR